MVFLAELQFETMQLHLSVIFVSKTQEQSTKIPHLTYYFPKNVLFILEQTLA